MIGSEYFWPGRFHERFHILTKIYKKTGNLRAVQLELGHTKVDTTFKYLGVELD